LEIGIEDSNEEEETHNNQDVPTKLKDKETPNIIHGSYIKYNPATDIDIKMACQEKQCYSFGRLRKCP
jgi:hypothetical protein